MNISSVEKEMWRMKLHSSLLVHDSWRLDEAIQWLADA